MLRRVGIIVVALIIVLLGTEWVLRSWVTSPSRQHFDAELGWVYQPHATLLSTREGGAHIVLNELGMNDSPLLAEPDVCRVLVLGDSYTEALQLPTESNFVELAEDKTGLDLVNAGRSGLSPPQYVVLALRVQPRVRANEYLAVLTTGDWRDIEKALDQVDVSSAGEIKLRSNSKDAMRQFLEPLTQHSALFTYLMRRGGVVWKRISDHRWFTALTQESEVVHQTKTEPTASSSHKEAEIRQLARTALVALNRDKPLRLIFVPKLNFSPESLQASMMQSAEVGRKFQDIAEELDLPFHDTTPALLASYQSTGEPTHGYQNASPVDGHPSPAGHRVIASGIATIYQQHPPCLTRLGGAEK